MSKHDFNGPIEKTSTELAKIILAKFLENKDTLIYEMEAETSKEVEIKQEEAITDFAISLMSIIGATDIPGDYASYPFDKLIAMLSTLKNRIDGTVRQIEDEIMSRFLESKSPETGKYRRETATMSTLMMKLDELRKQQGDNMSEYFNHNQAELSTEEVGVADEKK